MQLTPEVIAVISALAALVVAIVAIVRSGKQITPETVIGELQEATNVAQELTEVALTGARAAEQLYRTGKITRDERLTHALAYVRQWFPDLDNDSLITSVESAVFIVNAIANSAKKVEQTD